MKKNFIALLSTIPTIMMSVTSQASAIVQLDENRGLATIRSQLVFYGPEATEEASERSAKEVERFWNGGTNNEPSTQYLSTLIGGKKYQVIFEITKKIVTQAEAMKLMASNPSAELTFIQLLKGVTANGDRSYMNGLGSNQGTWYLSDDLGKSTTTAHEYGHGLGLDHPDEFDWRTRGQPGIMCPRGTYVQGQYQWNPASAAGAPGGTMSPYKRRVIQWDINNLQLGALKFDAKGVASLNKPLRETPWSLEVKEAKASFNTEEFIEESTEEQTVEPSIEEAATTRVY